MTGQPAIACEQHDKEQRRAQLEQARQEATRQAEAEVLRNGAAAPHTHVDEVPNGVDTYRLRAQAVGNPRLMAANGVP